MTDSLKDSGVFRQYRPTLKVLYVEDHEVTRVGTQAVLTRIHPNVDIVEIRTYGELQKAAARFQNADLLLLDLGLPDIDGPVPIGDVRTMFPDVPIVVLSGYGSSSLMYTAMTQGVSGFIVKNSSLQTISNALELVLDGEVFFPKHLVNEIFQESHLRGKPTVGQRDDERPEKSTCTHFASPSCDYLKLQERLTTRQLEVTRLVALGLPNKEIARALCISLGTAKNHVAEILRLLNCSNRKELIYKILASE